MTSSDAADTNATNTAGATATGHLITDRGLMIQMFRGLGFTEPVATHIVDQELIDNVAALRDLDDDRCESIAKIVRKVPTAAGSSTCHNVADKAVRNFQLAVAYAKHRERTTHTLMPNAIAPSMFEGIKIQREIEAKQKGVKVDLPTGLSLENPIKVAKTFEAVVEHLGRYRGISGVPLSYVVRTNLLPKGHYSDPAVGEQGSQYASYDAEMVARAPITLDGLNGFEDGPFHHAFMVDMTCVWEILHNLFHTQSVWLHVKKLQASRNGRACFRALHTHLLGGINATHLGLQIIAQLRQLKYEGNRKNFSFDKFVAKHVDLHNQAEALKSHGFRELTEEMKVDIFLRGISSSAGLESCKNTVIADPTYLGDFQRVKEHYVAYVRQRAAYDPPPTRNVSAVSTGSRKGGGSGSKKSEGKPSAADIAACNIKLRHYSKEEYAKLSAVERAKLHLLRTQRDTADNKPAKRSISSVSTTEDDSSSLAIPSDDEDSVKTSNTGHPALGRQPKRAKA